MFKIRFWVVIVTINLALLNLIRLFPEVFEPLAVTRISDLEVINYIQMNTSAGPTIKTITSDPSGAVIEPRGSLRMRTDAGNALLYINKNGGTTWETVGAFTNTTCSAGSVVTAVLSGGSTCTPLSSAGIQGTLGSATADNTWSGDVNVTTEGTIDWASYSTASNCSAQASRTVDTWQSKPPGPRSGRLWVNEFGNVTGFCAGTSGCNGTTSCVVGSAASGGTISTTAGVNNQAAASVATTLNGFLSNPTAVGYGMTQKIPIFEGEAAMTIRWYVKLVDSEATYTITLVENGTVVDTETATLSTGGNNVVGWRLSVPVTPGTGRKAFVQLTLTNTVRGGVNPRMFLYAVTIF